MTGGPPRLLPEAAAGVALAVCAVGLRAGLDPVLGGNTPFVLYFPAVTAACVVFGPIAGAVCLAVCSVGGVAIFLPSILHNAHAPRRWLPFLIYLASGSALVWLTARQRSSIDALRAAHRQETLLIGELQHRVKNTLAIVQSIASQSLRSGAPPDQLERAITERLKALAQAHDALSETNWESVSLRSLLSRTVAPFTLDDPSRVALQGEDVLAPSDQIVGLALCFHELATNAIKYGALSRPEGRVEIAWRILDGAAPPRLELVWAERDGPPVERPARRGFGSRVLIAGLAARTRPKVSLEYRPAGVFWRAEFDLSPA
jgi:two-component sensor histidine kinase